MAKHNYAYKKIRSFNVFGVVGFVILAVYALVNFIIRDYPAAIFEVVCCLGILASLYLINKKNDYDLGIDISSIILFALAVHNFYSGGFSATGLFWVFVIISTMFYVGGRESLRWVLWLIGVFTVLFILKLIGKSSLPYDDFTVVTFLASITTVSILNYFYNLDIEKSLEEADIAGAKDVANILRELKNKTEKAKSN